MAEFQDRRNQPRGPIQQTEMLHAHTHLTESALALSFRRLFSQVLLSDSLSCSRFLSLALAEMNQDELSHHAAMEKFKLLKEKDKNAKKAKPGRR